jgi:hypothetical protein
VELFEGEVSKDLHQCKLWGYEVKYIVVCAIQIFGWLPGVRMDSLFVFVAFISSLNILFFNFSV